MAADTETGSYVYVLTNEAMPGLVKIGRTSLADPEDRASQLYSTGVPLPFDVEYAALVDDPARVEKALHNAFRDQRVNPRREFFRIEPDQAIGILDLFGAEDVTATVANSLGSSVTDEERRAVEKERQRRPPLNFEEMSIPIGATLTFKSDSSKTVMVAEPRKVELNGEVMSITRATKEVLGEDRRVPPVPQWLYEGRPLQTIYDETYRLVD